MKHKLSLDLRWEKCYQMLKRLSQMKYWRGRKFSYFLLSLVVGIMIICVGMTHNWAVTSTPTYQTSWIGNTVGGGTLRVQNNIEAMYVATDGSVYTDSHWDEGGTEAAVYKDGKMTAVIEDTHGWSRNGGQAVTASSQYIYIAMVQGSIGSTSQDYPPDGTTWYCVRRYTLAGKAAPFTGGRGWDKSMLIISTKSEVTGLAIANNQLFISDAANQLIRVYNPNTMTETRNFSVANPGKIAVDLQGNLWIIQPKKATTAAKIVRYSPAGLFLGQQITTVVDPTAIAIDNQGRLLVAENGVLQQILIYNINSQPRQVGTFGNANGLYGGIPGENQPLKLYGLSGVGTDAAGNYYINNNGFNKSGTDLRKFSSSGQQQWQLLGLIFVDNADADPQTDGLDVFTKQEHYVMDFSKSPGKQWTYKDYTVNPFKYPQDARLHTSPDATFVRRIQGQPFLYLTDMYGTFMQIYRFNPSTDGKIAIPAGMFVGSNGANKPVISGTWPPNQPSKGEWIWRDTNGNGSFDSNEYNVSQDYPYLGGWWVDSKGDMWKALRSSDGIRRYPLQGLDTKGNPVYNYTSMVKQATPSLFTDLRRIEYYPATDTMYLSGFTKDHPSVGDDSGVVGSEIVRFDNWSQGNRTPRVRIVIPYDNVGNRNVDTAAMSVAGDYVFAVTVKTAEVYVYNSSTGTLFQKLKPGSEVGSESGWVDIPYGVRAFRRANGQYLVFVEEDWKGKVIMYQM